MDVFYKIVASLLVFSLVVGCASQTSRVTPVNEFVYPSQAQIENFSNRCDKMINESDDKIGLTDFCQYATAMYSGDIQYCTKESPKYMEGVNRAISEKDLCIANIAMFTNNIELCDQVKDPTAKLSCKVESSYTDLSKCSAIEDQRDCYFSVALSMKDPTFCAHAGDNSDSCYLMIAIATKKPIDCSSLNATEMFLKCEYLMGTAIYNQNSTKNVSDIVLPKISEYRDSVTDDNLGAGAAIFQPFGFLDYTGQITVSYDLMSGQQVGSNGFEIYFVKSRDVFKNFMDNSISTIEDYPSCQKKGVFGTRGECVINNSGGLVIYNPSNYQARVFVNYTVKTVS